VAQVLTRHGFGHIVERLQVRRIVPLPSWLAGPPPEAVEPDAMRSIGQRLVRVCEELGPTYVKLGQLVAARADILPAAVIEELSRLQDRVAPFPGEQARRIVLEALGRPIEEAFQRFDEEPFASGSMAQVHRGVAADGQRVVVKVRRPGIEGVIQTDVTVLRWLAAAAENHVPELRHVRPAMLVDEFAHATRRELDFINEASVTARFAEAFAGQPGLVFPAVRWDLTESGVLTLEHIDGSPLRDVLPDAARPEGAEFNRQALATRLAACFMRQYFELGLFHADPHPGNLLFLPPDRVALIDFGNAGQIDDELLGRLVIALLGTIRKEVDLVVDVLADTGALGEGTDRGVLRRDMREMLDKYYGLPLRRLALAEIFNELMEIVRRNDVTLPREFVLMGRSLVAAAGVALQLDPDLNLIEVIRPRLRETFLRQFSGRRLVREAGFGLWHLLNILRDAPRVLRDVLRRGARGQFQVSIRHQDLDRFAAELDRSSNRLAFSILMAAVFMGSSMVIQLPAEHQILNVSTRYFGFLGYILSFFMGVWLVIAILRSGRLS